MLNYPDLSDLKNVLKPTKDKILENSLDFKICKHNCTIFTQSVRYANTDTLHLSEYSLFNVIGRQNAMII